MNQFRLILLILASSVVEFVGCRRMIWNQRTNIADAHNWEGDKKPCASDILSFSEQSYELIKLSNFTMKEIILPKSGGFILDSSTTLQFNEQNSNCKTNTTALFKKVIHTPWLLSDNWNAAREVDGNQIITTFYNKATPHEERVPCDNDEIIFPINNSYVVDLQSQPSLSFKSITIDGRTMSLMDFKDFLMSEFGQAAFRNAENALFIESSCTDENKCVCHRKSEALLEQLCKNEQQYCQATPHCTNSIKPIGHCCFECGAVFQMKINDKIDNFDLKNFETKIARAIRATSAINSELIVYHISVTAQQQQLYLQLIIVDRYEYNEQSTKLMNILKKTVLDSMHKDQSKFYFISGMPFTPNESGHVLAFIFGTFFLVALFMTVIYAVYYDDKHIPRVMATMRSHQLIPTPFRSEVNFARFDNTLRSHAGDDASSVVEVDLHFGSDQSIENFNSAFNNPMFDQNIPAEATMPIQGSKGTEETGKSSDEAELKED